MKRGSLGVGLAMLIAASALSIGCRHKEMDERTAAAATRAEDAARRAEAAASRVEAAAKRTEAAAERAEQMLSRSMR
jgi:hypothetical protein